MELDRLGSFQDFELSKDNKGKTVNLSIEQKRERLIYLFKALENIWGGGKQSRLLTDISPKFLAITFQTAKSPIFLETLTVSETEELNTSAVSEVLTGNATIISEKFLGVQSGIFKNDVSGILNTGTIQNAFSSAVNYINKIEF